uniref:hypothetical protein n=1 Tax=Klebsiella pneumoniae TaxID=573 RepID=UPI001954EB01
MSRLLRTGLNAGTEAPRVVGGSGVHFVLDDGRRVLDGSNTGGPLGHGHPRMAEALRKAAERDETRGRTITALRGRVARVEQHVLDALGEPPAGLDWERLLGRAGRRGGP